MAALDKAVLELTADVDDDGTEETGVFKMVGDVNYSQEVQKDYVFENTASGLVTLAANLTGFEAEARKGFYLDVGAGQHVIEFEFRGWEGSNSQQWGDGTGTFPGDATGDDVFRQIQCISRYVQLATTDSFNPATLHIGEYTDGSYGDNTNGAFDPLEVAVSGPRQSKGEDQFKSFDGSITCLEVISLDQPVDLVENSKRGT